MDPAKEAALAWEAKELDFYSPWGLKNFNKDRGDTIINSSQSSFDTHKS